MYENIKCPKCGKRYFQVKQHNTGFIFDMMPLVFKSPSEPVYKDGVLQNPPKPEPVKERFKCLECGCNFRSETFPNVGDAAVVPNLIDEDLELQNLKEKLDSQKPQPIKTDRLTINKEERLDKMINSKFEVVPNSGTVSILGTYATKEDIKHLEELIDEMSDTMKKRFEKIEGSCKQ